MGEARLRSFAVTATRLLAPAKVTLSLRMTGLRDDGYHLIDAEMVTVDLCDELLIDPAGSGVTVAGADVDDTLVAGALRLAGRTAGVTLTKRIPAGAGLGGGSSDAAAVLRWAGYDDLVGASGLGADIAFCLVGGRARVRGIGEIVDPLPFEERTLTLLTPPFGCSTPAVYAAWDELGGPTGRRSRSTLAATARARWRRGRDRRDPGRG